MEAPRPQNDLELVVALFAALEAGKVEEALDMLDPHVEWSPIGLSGRGPLTGREGVRPWFEEFGRQPGRIHVEVDDVFRLGHWVVALGTVDDTRDGLGEVTPVGWNLEIVDGLVRVAQGCDSWSRALDAAGTWSDATAGSRGGTKSTAHRRSPARPPSTGQPHPHRAPSRPAVGDAV